MSQTLMLLEHMKRGKNEWRFRARKHGHSHSGQETRTYKIWKDMRRRCANASRPTYKYYGGRGITVCERWQEFANFLADMGEAPTGLSIDRIDNDGNYEPDNCRWADQTTQVNNSRVIRWITFNGETKSLTEWARSLKIKRLTLLMRLKRGWSTDQALGLATGHGQKIREYSLETQAQA